MSCGNRTADYNFAGEFEDEFGNRFELKEDMTAIVELVNTGNEIKTVWTKHKRVGMVYAAIAYNGSPDYFILSPEGLYRHFDDMKSKRRRITITYKTEENK